jgi:tetratricopeptide (TPR) repeat protein
MSEALRWARLAEAMRQRGQTDAETRIAYHHHLANVLAAHQRSDDAQSHYQHALTIARRELSEPRPAMAKLIANLAMIDEDNGETESASRGFGEALALLEERVGTTHPILVPALEGLARTAVVRGQGEAARDALQRALAINESTFGESSLPVAHVLATLGGIHLQEGRPTEARPVLTRALSILQSEPGAETEAASLLTNLGLVHAALNEVEPATARFEAALALFEQIDPQGPRQSYPLLGLARLRLQNGDVEAAASLSQRALELRQEANMPPPLLAEAQLCRAQALAARPPGGPRNEQTCRLARAAQRALADAGIAYVDLLREANDLLAPQTGACPP